MKKGVLLLLATLAALAAWVFSRGDASEPRSALDPAPRVHAAQAGGEALTVETFISDLDTPWDLAWGPDGRMWITERGGRVLRVDMDTRGVSEAGRLDVTEVSESGLMGIAFHPDFATAPWVYVAHSYRAGGIRNRVVRMRWDGARLGPPETIVDDVPGAGNHNGSRLAFGPDGMLYITTGDAARAAYAQDRASLAGKVLRVTPEGRPAPGNPGNTAVWSWGHRNAQGLVFRPGTDELYATEHGPNDNDEVNRILPGRNYGWPDVRGACDTDEEREFCRTHDVVEPIVAFTPTLGLAGIDWYGGDRIPGWHGSLVHVALRGATLLRTDPATGQTARYFGGEYGRLRDVLVGPDGVVYVATSNRDGRGRPAPDDDRVLRITP